MARHRKMTTLGNRKSRDEKWLKISILIHLQLVVTDLFFMVQNRLESLCSSITPLTWFFPWFSFLFYHIESWISSLSHTECLCVLRGCMFNVSFLFLPSFYRYTLVIMHWFHYKICSLSKWKFLLGFFYPWPSLTSPQQAAFRKPPPRPKTGAAEASRWCFAGTRWA